jgi:hypothetical protein
MPDQQCGEVCGKILVKQYSHLPRQFRRLHQAPQWRIRALQVQKFIKALATFQVIEKGADWNTSTDKHQAAAEDIGVSVRNIGKCGHGTSPYSVVSISLVGPGT